MNLQTSILQKCKIVSKVNDKNCKIAKNVSTRKLKAQEL